MPAIATSTYVSVITSAGSRRSVRSTCGRTSNSAEAGGADSADGRGAAESAIVGTGASLTVASGGRRDRETFAAAALAGRVRILEHELRVETFALEIDFGAVDERQPLPIDQHADAVEIEREIAVGRRVRDVHRVGIARATGALDAEANADRAGFGEVGLHARTCVFGELDRHVVVFVVRCDNSAGRRAGGRFRYYRRSLLVQCGFPGAERQGMSASEKNMVSVKHALSGALPAGSIVTVRGWVRTRRDSKAGLSFVNVSDGSCFDPIPVVAPGDLPNYADEVAKLTAGCAVVATGELVPSQGKGQAFEIQAKRIDVVGWVDD